MTPFDAQRLRAWNIPDVSRTFTSRDTILYALGVGLGADPCSADELRFVYEDRLQALPSFGTVLAYPFLWYAEPGTGVDLAHVVQAEMGFENHATLPVEGSVVGRTRVTAVQDKGADVGALLVTSCEVSHIGSHAPICTLYSSSLARSHGGFEQQLPKSVKVPQPDERSPDATCDIPTLPQAALIYRLSGDANPLHADPAQARLAGFPRPLLHGRCTFAVAAWALLRLCCGYDPRRLLRMRARFSSPVYPGEIIRTEVWQDGPSVRFRALVPARGVVVLSHGTAGVAQQG
ncbi:MAG: MaoC/PaaZ C-terminal domain-containing protein [Pseudomonadota bacterium]